jgi:hypothetical protein
MGIQIRSPRFSFVQLYGSQYGYTPEQYGSCNFPNVQWCLPVYAYDDVAFEFLVVTDTVDEANELCALGSTDKVEVGLVRDCGDDFDLNFNAAYLQPQRVRVAEKQVLYKWPHGFPGFDAVFAIEDCFLVKVIVHMEAGDVSACSNCFQRIAQDCFTSLLEYGAEQNIFGFNYCDSGTVVEEELVPCEEPTVISFADQTMIDITYTDEMKAKYGDVPTVEIWTLDNGEYVKTFIRAGFDAYPPTKIIADLGGLASGFLKIS